MSFRKPKKAIRPRVVVMNPDDSEDEEMDTTPAASNNSPLASETNNGTSKTSNKAASLLSFDEDLDADGEVFQVKKSSVSRRLMKQRDKEKKNSTKSKKLNEGEKQQVKGFVSQIKIKMEGKSSEDVNKDKDFVRVLNGREAEAVDMESEDEEEDETSAVRFRRPKGGTAIQDAVRQALERGQIPDANLIHEARKRKQMAREMGHEFIPVDNVDRFKGEKGRLVREDDDNEGSDEERLDFSSATNSYKLEREKRIEEFNAARDEDENEQDSDEEIDEWESQQIRKGVSQIAMQNVAKELYNQGYINSPNSNSLGNSNDNMDTSAFSLYPHPQLPISTKKGGTQAFMEQTQRIANIEEIINGSKKITAEQILGQMSDRLVQLKLSQDRNEGELSRLEADWKLADSELKEANEVKSGLNSRFIMYQNLRGYVTDLVDCLRCKVPIIEELENRMLEMINTRRSRFIERRRQDIRDQTEEVAASINIMGGVPVAKPPPTNPERTRRAAEREGRRTRRRRLREKEMKNVKDHKDGLSSDDEQAEYENSNFEAVKENLITEVSTVFDDVHEDFGTIDGILSRFEEWKEADCDAYKESYAFACLPKCLAPLIRVQLLCWNPLKNGCDILKYKWAQSLLSYSYKKNETLNDLTFDPDSRLVPTVVEKVLISWLKRYVEADWDPMSGSQTRELVNVIKRLVDEFSISASSKPMHSLLETIISKLKETLDNDIYVPIYPKTALATVFTPASVFLSRQFWSSVKLLDNMSKWQGVLSDKPLQNLALDGLLTRYSLLGIRVAPDLTESAERAKGVVHVLPRAWLQRDANSEVPNGLQQLSRCLVTLVQSSDCTIAANRIGIPEIANILKSIGSTSEAQIILRKYS